MTAWRQRRLRRGAVTSLQGRQALASFIRSAPFAFILCRRSWLGVILCSPNLLRSPPTHIMIHMFCSRHNPQAPQVAAAAASGYQMTVSIGKRNGRSTRRRRGGGRHPPTDRCSQTAAGAGGAGAPRVFMALWRFLFFPPSSLPPCLALPSSLYLLCTLRWMSESIEGATRRRGGPSVPPAFSAKFPPHFICFAPLRRRRRRHKSDLAPFPSVLPASLPQFPSILFYRRCAARLSVCRCGRPGEIRSMRHGGLFVKRRGERELGGAFHP